MDKVAAAISTAIVIGSAIIGIMMVHRLLTGEWSPPNTPSFACALATLALYRTFEGRS